MGVNVGCPVMRLYAGKPSSKKGGNMAAILHEGFESIGKDGQPVRYSADADRARLACNEYTGYQFADDLLDAINMRVADYAAEFTQRTGRAMRRDSVLAYSVIIKPPAEWIQGLDEDKRAQFWTDSREILRDILPDQMATALHRDEMGEHLHIVGMPFTPDGRLSAYEVLNLALNRRLNRDYPAQMQARGWPVNKLVNYDPDKAAQMDEDERAKYKAQCKAKAARHGKSTAEYKADKAEQAAKKMEAEKARLEADVRKSANIAACALADVDRLSDEIARKDEIARQQAADIMVLQDKLRQAQAQAAESAEEARRRAQEAARAHAEAEAVKQHAATQKPVQTPRNGIRKGPAKPKAAGYTVDGCGNVSIDRGEASSVPSRFRRPGWQYGD